MRGEQGRSEVGSSQSLKKSILWNVVQPGDPYDIRKSMIARLPGDTKPYMGNRLELICLLQAAEIERLALNLEEFRVRFYEVEKNTLDRHSYEVQIKQLAATLQGKETTQVQNQKLKNFIERLNQELDQARKLSSSNSQLTANYQQALLQAQALSDQNRVLSTELAQLKQVLAAKNSENLNLQAHARDLEESERQLQAKLKDNEEDERRMAEYEARFNLIGEEIKRLNSVLKAKTDENLAIKSQLQTLTNNLRESKNYGLAKKEENDHLAEQIQQLQQEVERLSQKKDSDYQKKLSSAGRQIQRLNQVLKAKIDDINNLQVRGNRLSEENQGYAKQIAVLEKQVKDTRHLLQQNEELQLQLSQEQTSKERLAKTNNDLLRRINDLSLQMQKQPNYEEKIQKLSEQLRRLAPQLQSLQSDNRNLNADNRTLLAENNILQTEKLNLQGRLREAEGQEGELRRVSKELAELKSVMAQEDIGKRTMQERAGELSRKTHEYQRIIEQLSGQIKRLNDILKAKLADIANLEQQIRLHSNSEEENRDKLERYEDKLALLSHELDRLNGSLKDKLIQNVQLTGQIEAIGRQNAGQGKEITALQEQLIHFSKIKQADDAMEAKLTEYRNEIVRLNEVSRVRFEESNRELNSLKQEVQILRQENAQLRGQLEQAQRRLGDAVRELEDAEQRLAEAQEHQQGLGDLQRLNNLLRLKVEESGKWEASNLELIHKIQSLEDSLQREAAGNHHLHQQLQQLTKQRDSTLAQFKDYKLKIQHLFAEVQRLQQILENIKIENTDIKKENADIRRENGDLKKDISDLKRENGEIKRDSVQLRKENADLRREIAQLRRQLGQGTNLKEKNDKLLKEIERLNALLSQQEEDLRQLKQQLTQENTLDRKIKQQMSLIIQSLRNRLDAQKEELQNVRKDYLAALKD